MKRIYGLFVGINDYGDPEVNLQGCVNDAHDWRDAIGPRLESATVLLDKQATRYNILSNLDALLDQLREEDVLLLQYSGHGTWVPDTSGDEPDGRDEALVPVDAVQDDGRLILDDEIRATLQQRNPKSRVVYVFDSCHSGTVYQMMDAPSDDREISRIRFLDPARILPEAAKPVAQRLAMQLLVPRANPLGGGVYFAGCQDTQFSYDAVFNGKPNGAFTYVALQAMKKLPPRANFQVWAQEIRKKLPTRQNPQTPRITATKKDAQQPIPWLV